MKCRYCLDGLGSYNCFCTGRREDRVPQEPAPQANEFEWVASEDQIFVEAKKACDERCRTYNSYDCDRDGSCAECQFDAQWAHRVEA